MYVWKTWENKNKDKTFGGRSSCGALRSLGWLQLLRWLTEL